MLYSGVCLNVMASVISGVVQINTKISQKMLQDVKNIKGNDYVDEGVVSAEGVNAQSRRNQKSSPPSYFTDIFYKHKSEPLPNNEVLDLVSKPALIDEKKEQHTH